MALFCFLHLISLISAALKQLSADFSHPLSILAVYPFLIVFLITLPGNSPNLLILQSKSQSDGS